MDTKATSRSPRARRTRMGPFCRPISVMTTFAILFVGVIAALLLSGAQRGRAQTSEQERQQMHRGTLMIHWVGESGSAGTQPGAMEPRKVTAKKRETLDAIVRFEVPEDSLRFFDPKSIVYKVNLDNIPMADPELLKKLKGAMGSLKPPNFYNYYGAQYGTENFLTSAGPGRVLSVDATSTYSSQSQADAPDFHETSSSNGSGSGISAFSVMFSVDQFLGISVSSKPFNVTVKTNQWAEGHPELQPSTVTRQHDISISSPFRAPLADGSLSPFHKQGVLDPETFKITRDANSLIWRGSGSGHRRETSSGFNGDPQWSEVSASMNFTFDLSEHEDLEAVIVTEQPEESSGGTPIASLLPVVHAQTSSNVPYDKWLPEAGDDEDTPGNDLTVTIVLRKKGNKKKPPVHTARFEIELANVSHEPGVCMNWPPKNKVKTPPTPDLKIDPNKNPKLHDFKDTRDGQTAKSDEGQQEVPVTVTSYDWGAYGKLRAKAYTSDGQKLTAYWEDHPDKKELAIPKDDNDNHIADAWEPPGPLSLSPDGDEDALPAGDGHTGDVLSAYEEYRGFHAAKDPKAQKNHIRTDPFQKDIFVDLDSNFTFGYFGTSGLGLHPVDRTEYTTVSVKDPAIENPRVINFNFDPSKKYRIGNKHVILAQNGKLQDGRLGASYEREGLLIVDKASCDSIGKDEYNDQMAHELGHHCHLQHHGDPDYLSEAVKLAIGPLPPWLLPTLSKHSVAVQNGEHSGDLTCVMRYHRGVSFYELPGAQTGQVLIKRKDGTWVWGNYYVPEEVGTQFCSGKDGNPKNSKLGPAARGQCTTQFCVNDLKHPF